MAGIYIHIPFCSQACHYCNFHFSTNMKRTEEMIACIIREIRNRSTNQPIDTIYFGGGTPSVIAPELIKEILTAVNESFDTSQIQELTLEANPEDMSIENLNFWKEIGVQRLSVGVQSFFDDELRAMNRIHHAKQAEEAIANAYKVGFNSLNLDLIYGMPWSTTERFIENLDLAESLGVDHLSCYALTVEEKTALAYQIKKGQVLPVDDQQALRDFSELQSWAQKKGFEHYEISNLARPGRRAKHNSQYWQGQAYLGFGPGAHSFGGKKRSWNRANNALYIRDILSEEDPSDSEELTAEDQYNEWVMTGLRLSDGLAIHTLEQWPPSILEVTLPSWSAKRNAGILIEESGHLVLKEDQRFFADGHASDLFFV